MSSPSPTHPPRGEDAAHDVPASEVRFRALVENAYDLTSISTPDGHIAYMSPSVLSVLGYEPAELEGQWAFAYVHPDDAPQVGRELARVVAAPSTAGHAEYRFRGAFWQARHADRRGLGLGLSIALSVAEGHGGRLWVESEAGQGTTFVLTLPAHGR